MGSLSSTLLGTQLPAAAHPRKKAMGHTSVTTTQLYEHSADEHVDALLDLAARGKVVAREAAKA